MFRPESTRATGRSASPACAAVAGRTARVVAAVRQSLPIMSSPPELFRLVRTTARAEAAGSSFLSVMLEARTAGGDLANGQLLVSAVGRADALLQGLVLLAKRGDAA